MQNKLIFVTCSLRDINLKKKYGVAALLITVTVAIVILSFLYVNLASEVITDDFEQNTSQGDLGEWPQTGTFPKTRIIQV